MGVRGGEVGGGERGSTLRDTIAENVIKNDSFCSLK